MLASINDGSEATFSVKRPPASPPTRVPGYTAPSTKPARRWPGTTVTCGTTCPPQVQKPLAQRAAESLPHFH